MVVAAWAPVQAWQATRRGQSLAALPTALFPGGGRVPIDTDEGSRERDGIIACAGADLGAPPIKICKASSNGGALACGEASHGAEEEDAASTLGGGSYTDVCLGGTFDHMHAGHKVLLSRAALLCSRRLVCGVSDGSLLATKRYAEQLASTEDRCADVMRFLTTIRRGVEHQVTLASHPRSSIGTKIPCRSYLAGFFRT